MPDSQVLRYEGQREYVVRLDGLRWSLPVVKIRPHTWIASNASLILGDVAFVSKAAELLGKRVRSRGVEAILTAEAKSIALAYELSKELGIERFAVARKSLKAYMGKYASQKVSSITTKTEQELLLTDEEIRWLSGRKVCLLDDVVSTGATLRALEALAERAGAVVGCKAAVWKEGPWYKARDLIYIQTLPVFTDGAGTV